MRNAIGHQGENERQRKKSVSFCLLDQMFFGAVFVAVGAKHYTILYFV